MVVCSTNYCFNVKPISVTWSHRIVTWFKSWQSIDINLAAWILHWCYESCFSAFLDRYNIKALWARTRCSIALLDWISQTEVSMFSYSPIFDKLFPSKNTFALHQKSCQYETCNTKIISFFRTKNDTQRFVHFIQQIAMNVYDQFWQKQSIIVLN